MDRKPKSGLCRWACERKTGNRSSICVFCWQAAKPSRTMNEAGYQAWAEGKRAKAINPKRQAAGRKGAIARLGKLEPHLLATALLNSETA